MKKLQIFVILLLLSTCSTEVIKKKDTHKDNLTKFFNRCVEDINNAKKVIVEHDIIKNLTHLQKMNAGGKKYYLLERESITKMLKSVTKGIYADFILINKHGTIIYTRENDSIFAKNVNGKLKGTPLLRCYLNKDKGVYFEDVFTFEPGSENYSLFVSDKVKGGNTFPGIFILQVGISKIEKIMDKNTDIIGNKGIYKIHHNHDKILSKYKFFNKIDINSLNKNKINQFTISKNTKVEYKQFLFRNISWILITEKKR